MQYGKAQVTVSARIKQRNFGISSIVEEEVSCSDCSCRSACQVVILSFYRPVNCANFLNEG